MLDFIIQKAYAASYPGPDSTTGSGAGFNTLLTKILNNIVNPVVYLLIALAVIYFLYGMFQFIRNADDTTKRKEGYDHMIWGVIGLFIMLSAKGIINLILSTMGL